LPVVGIYDINFAYDTNMEVYTTSSSNIPKIYEIAVKAFFYPILLPITILHGKCIDGFETEQCQHGLIELNYSQATRY
jgi:hypothetical protein